MRSPGRINLGAALALSSWLVALLVAVSQGRTWGWTSATTLGLLAVAVLGFALWIAVELRSSEPLVDVRMMRQRPVWWTNVSALLFGFGMYSLMVMIPSFMSAPAAGGYGFGSTPTGVGLAMLPNTFGMLVIGLVIGRITGRWGAKLPLVVGGILDAVALAALAVAHDQLWMVFASLALFGLGMGLAFSSMTNVIVDVVPPEQTGVATGMNANIRTIGGSIGSQVVSAIIVAHAAPGALPAESGYTHGMVVMAIALAAGGVAAIAIPSTMRARGRAAVGAGAGAAGSDPRAEQERIDGAVYERPELALAADAVLVAAAADMGGHRPGGRI